MQRLKYTQTPQEATSHFGKSRELVSAQQVTSRLLLIRQSPDLLQLFKGQDKHSQFQEGWHMHQHSRFHFHFSCSCYRQLHGCTNEPQHKRQTVRLIQLQTWIFLIPNPQIKELSPSLTGDLLRGTHLEFPSVAWSPKESSPTPAKGSHCSRTCCDTLPPISQR